MKQKIVEFDWIRGLSALLIVLYHYTVQYQHLFGHFSPWPIQIAWGCGAVNVFFCLSGFLTVYTLDSGDSPLEFALKKAKRLYPTYWICILITSITMRLLCPELLCDFKTIIINYSMIQNFIKVENVDGIYWTLSFELIFYFYFGVILFFKQLKNQIITNLSLIWLALSLLFFILSKNGVSNVVIHLFNLVFMPRFAAPFCGGIFISLLAKKQSHDWILYFGIITSVIVSFYGQELSYAVLYSICVLIMLLVVIERFVFQNNNYNKQINCIGNYLKPLVFLARISYPLYLLHQYVGFAIIKKIEILGFTSEFFIIVPIIIVIGISFLVQLIIEKIHCNKKPIIVN